MAVLSEQAGKMANDGVQATEEMDVMPREGLGWD